MGGAGWREGCESRNKREEREGRGEDKREGEVMKTGAMEMLNISSVCLFIHV